MRKELVWLMVASLFAACGTAATDAPGGDRGASKPGSWRVLADAPLSPRSGHHGVWTGREMVLWGGTELSDRDGLEFRPAGDGAAYDPAQDSWRKISPAPFGGGGNLSSVWTGREMILWGGGDDAGASASVGGAYDPEADAWRVIAPGPLPGRAGHLAVWTGAEMIVWGGSLTGAGRERYDGRGAAYDPRTDSWRELPRGPLPAGYDATGAWTGSEVVVLATPVGDEPAGAPKRAEAAAYDPARDTWRSLSRPPMAAYVGPPGAFLDGELFLLSLGGTVDGGETNGYARPYETGGILNVVRNQWRAHSAAPSPPNQSWPQVALEDEIVIDGLAYRPADDSWRALPDFPLHPREFPCLVWTGDELIVWGGAELAEGDVHYDPAPLLGDGAAYAPGT
ncbi:MAG TPA: hypothetical protein VM784_15435 [Actinomycetota bacterium]|nr:hypothetical protein [Actinomycetota bacterium]